MPEIVLSTGSFFPNTELGFRMAAELGYDGVELMVNHDRPSQSLASVVELSATYHVPVRAVHVPCLMVSQHVWGWRPEVKLRRSLDLAAAVGADVVVTHPPFRWQRDYAAAFGRLVDELNHEGGPVVTVENMYSVAALGRSVEPYLGNDDRAFGRYGALTLDTSHVGAARQELLERYHLMRGRVRHLHLSDSTSTRGDEHLPPTQGTLPLAALAAEMTADGYDGQVVLEVAIGRLPEGVRTATARECLEWAAEAFAPAPRRPQATRPA